MNNLYHAKTNAFYCAALISSYEAAGTLPPQAELKEVSLEVFAEFSGVAPSGKVRSAGPKGLPDWAGYIEPPETDENKKSRLKLEGVEFEGVMCSATASDMWGLTSVRLDYDEIFAGGGTSSTSFKFENGNTIVLTTENYKNLLSVWRPFRASFFA